MQHVRERADTTAKLLADRYPVAGERKLPEPIVEAVEGRIGRRETHPRDTELEDRTRTHKARLERRRNCETGGRTEVELRKRIHFRVREKRRREDADVTPILHDS